MTTAREAITEAYKAFEEAFYKGEADTISRMYTEDAALLLTPNKPSAYLRTTCEDCSRPTVLAFVVPTARLTAIEFELLDRASLGGFGTFEFRGAPSQACLFSPAD